MWRVICRWDGQLTWRGEGGWKLAWGHIPWSQKARGQDGETDGSLSEFGKRTSEPILSSHSGRLYPFGHPEKNQNSNPGIGVCGLGLLDGLITPKARCPRLLLIPLIVDWKWPPPPRWCPVATAQIAHPLISLPRLVSKLGGGFICISPSRVDEIAPFDL